MVAAAPLIHTHTAPPLVSVLTPFYNEEPYLRECIESVLAQSHANFELILVDNASTDGSRAVAEEYLRRDKRIRLLACDEHVCLMENLNRAAHAVSPQARYVKYCFGDDWIYPNCLELMVAKLEANPRVGSVCAYALIEDEVFPYGPRHSESVMSGREAARRFLLTDRPMFGTPSASMFRAEVVREREQFFNHARTADDIEPEMNSFLKWDFAFIHHVLSFTRRERPSTSSNLNRLALLSANPLICLYKYAPHFLKASEQRARRRVLNRRYGEEVAEAMARTGFREVLRAHRQELANAGLAIPVWSVARGLVQVMLKFLCHPRRSYHAFVRDRAERHN